MEFTKEQLSELICKHTGRGEKRKNRLRYEADDIRKMSSNGKIQGLSAG